MFGRRRNEQHPVMMVVIARRKRTIFQCDPLEELSQLGKSSSGTILDRPSSIVIWFDAKKFLTVVSIISNFSVGRA